jgi:hypothetical protein
MGGKRVAAAEPASLLALVGAMAEIIGRQLPSSEAHFQVIFPPMGQVAAEALVSVLGAELADDMGKRKGFRIWCSQRAADFPPEHPARQLLARIRTAAPHPRAA